MDYYERYKVLILDKIAKGELTKEFIKQTTERIKFYKDKKKITKAQYDELIALMGGAK